VTISTLFVTLRRFCDASAFFDGIDVMCDVSTLFIDVLTLFINVSTLFADVDVFVTFSTLFADVNVFADLEVSLIAEFALRSISEMSFL